MSSAEEISWEELARRIQHNEPAAEEEFGAYFHPRVVAMAVVRLRDSEAAREIAQDTLLAVLQAVRESKVREPEKLPGFVYGTARNLVNNHLRAQSQLPDSVPLNADLPAPVNLSESLELKEEREAVRAALNNLKPVDRRILLLTLVEGMNPREIAPQVGLTPENVRTRKTRAVKAVIEEMRRMSRKPAANHL